MKLNKTQAGGRIAGSSFPTISKSIRQSAPIVDPRFEIEYLDPGGSGPFVSVWPVNRSHFH